MKWNFSVENLSVLSKSVLSGSYIAGVKPVKRQSVLRAVIPHLARKEWMMKQVTRLANNLHEIPVNSAREESMSLGASSLQHYVDEVGHHQTYSADLVAREPSLNRLSRNIEQLEMMNSRLEFMMGELSSLSKRFR